MGSDTDSFYVDLPLKVHTISIRTSAAVGIVRIVDIELIIRLEILKPALLVKPLCLITTIIALTVEADLPRRSAARRRGRGGRIGTIGIHDQRLARDVLIKGHLVILARRLIIKSIDREVSIDIKDGIIYGIIIALRPEDIASTIRLRGKVKLRAPFSILRVSVVELLLKVGVVSAFTVYLAPRAELLAIIYEPTVDFDIAVHGDHGCLRAQGDHFHIACGRKVGRKCIDRAIDVALYVQIGIRTIDRTRNLLFQRNGARSLKGGTLLELSVHRQAITTGRFEGAIDLRKSDVGL